MAARGQPPNLRRGKKTRTHTPRTHADRMPMFQSSPNPQTGCDGRCRAPRGHVVRRVSILTQSSDWVRQPPAHHRYPSAHRFNPHPILRLGATTPAPGTSGVAIVVSILTQSSDWVRRCSTDNSGSTTSCFNPHPILRLGATLRVRRPHPAAGRRFNPHPILRLGATLLDARRYASTDARFNPHPILRLGATPHQFLMMWTGKRGSFARTPPAASQ